MIRDTNDTIRMSLFYHTEFKRYTIVQFSSFLRIVFQLTIFKESRQYINNYPIINTKKEKNRKYSIRELKNLENTVCLQPNNPLS